MSSFQGCPQRVGFYCIIHGIQLPSKFNDRQFVEGADFNPEHSGLFRQRHLILVTKGLKETPPKNQTLFILKTNDFYEIVK